jgi:hypothetical protein
MHEAREKESLPQGILPLKWSGVVGVWIEVSIMLSWRVASADRQRGKRRVFVQW